MKVKELIRELQKLDGELKVFAYDDMWDVCYGEVIGIDTSNVIFNSVKEEIVELEFTDTRKQYIVSVSSCVIAILS